MLRGRDVQDYEELKRQGLSIRAISRLTGYCRKTVRKYFDPTRHCAGVRTSVQTTRQVGAIQAVPGGSDACRRVECLADAASTRT